ncbi:MAG: SRPBCC family protein [Caulobacteraceae bacterium]
MSSRVLVALRVKAPPDRAFAAFTGEIGAWWRPNPMFQFTPRDPGVLSFEAGEGGRLIETLPNGKVFEIGKVRVWAPPHRLVFGWRQATFDEGQNTQVDIRFEAVGEETRVTVEHTGWDSVPAAHVARHRFPDAIFLRRHAEWWQLLLASYKQGLDGGKDETR